LRKARIGTRGADGSAKRFDHQGARDGPPSRSEGGLGEAAVGLPRREDDAAPVPEARRDAPGVREPPAEQRPVREEGGYG